MFFDVSAHFEVNAVYIYINAVYLKCKYHFFDFVSFVRSYCFDDLWVSDCLIELAIGGKCSQVHCEHFAAIFDLSLWWQDPDNAYMRCRPFWCFCVFLVCIWECWLGFWTPIIPIFDGKSSHEVCFSIRGQNSEYGASQGFGNQFSQWSLEVENRGFSKIHED